MIVFWLFAHLTFAQSFGDRCRKAFVTAGTHNGDFNGNGDSFCVEQASQTNSLFRDKATLFRAWMSTSTSDARSRFADLADDTCFQKANGQNVTITIKGLYDGTLFTLLRNTQLPDVERDGRVWTGTLSNGTRATGRTCNDWKTPGSGQSATVGTTLNRTEGLWTNVGQATCDSKLYVYCFEVLDPPPPTTRSPTPKPTPTTAPPTTVSSTTMKPTTTTKSTTAQNIFPTAESSGRFQTTAPTAPESTQSTTLDMPTSTQPDTSTASSTTPTTKKTTTPTSIRSSSASSYAKLSSTSTTDNDATDRAQTTIANTISSTPDRLSSSLRSASTDTGLVVGIIIAIFFTIGLLVGVFIWHSRYQRQQPRRSSVNLVDRVQAMTPSSLYVGESTVLRATVFPDDEPSMTKSANHYVSIPERLQRYSPAHFVPDDAEAGNEYAPTTVPNNEYSNVGLRK